ncbi:MAG: LuxR C-terminal-related transcriptional regulator [Nocardioidaceae bacterium]
MGGEVRAARQELGNLAGRSTAGDEFGVAVSRTVRTLVDFDGWCLIGLDPNNRLRTFQFGGHGVEVTVDNAQNEWLMSDVNQYADLAVREQPIGWLSEAHPEACTSYRMNEILRPQGVTSEMRMVLRDAGNVWGALVLFREHPRQQFGEAEVSALSAVADLLSKAIRAHPVRPAPRVEALPAGTVLLDRDNQILAISHEAQAWLDDLVPGGEDQTWPKDVTRVLFDAANTLRTNRARASTCIRTVSGRWLAVTATGLHFHGADVALTLDAASPQQILRTCVLHHGLTPREQQVVALAVAGLASKQLARRLGISVWTVNEHLASAYRKFGVSSREELVGILV